MEEQNQSKVKKRDLSRVLENPLFWVVFLILGFGLPIVKSMQKKAPAPLPVLSQLEDFRLKNQEGRDVSYQKDFLGSVVVANFIFTSCPTSCPLLSSQMQKIQERVRSARGAIRLLSISVDPETDTPQVLKKYATEYKADPFVWSFVTGPIDEIERVVVKGFKVALDLEGKKQRVDGIMDITHGEHFVIVDQLGRIRAYSRANNESEINDIVRKVAILMNSTPVATKAR